MTLLAVVAVILSSVPAMGAEINQVFGRELVTLTATDIAADETLEHAKYMENPVWSSDGTMIAFVGHSSIYVVSAVGGVPKQVLNLAYTFEIQGETRVKELPIRTNPYLCFSPDGTELIFNEFFAEELGSTLTITPFESGGYEWRVTNGVKAIRAVNIQTGETRIVVEDAQNPAFTRDGAYFTYVDYATNKAVVREIATGAENVLDIFLDSPYQQSYCLDKSGGNLVYSSSNQFHRIPLAGGQSEQISQFTDNPWMSDPVMGTDSELILFTGSGGSRSTTSNINKLFVYSRQTGISTPLFPLEDNIESNYASFSPDGRYICYTWDYLGGHDPKIYIKKFDPAQFEKTTLVEIETPESFSVISNYPNPFNPSTTVTFALPAEETVHLAVYNLAGQRVRTLVESRLVAGTHDIVWDGRDERGQVVSSGVYVARLASGTRTASVTMTLVK